jgi:hypothetical protein
MKRFMRTMLAGMILFGVAAAGQADTTITGEKQGAFFRITVPDAWNGDLVINNHGFSFGAPTPNPGLGALAPLMLSEGYAVAASSYSQCCWALFSTQQDLNRLLGVFEANFGAPNNVILHGGSLGGIVTAQGIEKLDANVVGAYPICGALSGSRSWDGGIDLRLVYDSICGAVPGAAIPGPATGLPAPGHPGYPFSLTQSALAANACMGVLAPPAFRTPAQTARLAQFLAVTQIPESFVVTDIPFASHGVSNVIFDPGKLAGGQGMSNIGVTYNDPAVDAAILRVAPDKQARKELQKFYTPKGEVGATKIVSIHTDKDGLVIVENESDYQSKVPAANLSVGVVVEAAPSHCGFTEGELVAGWELLRGWIAGAPQPTASDIQGTCQLLVGLGYAAGPCRIEPGSVIGDMSARIPLR